MVYSPEKHKQVTWHKRLLLILLASHRVAEKQRRIHDLFQEIVEESNPLLENGTIRGSRPLIGDPSILTIAFARIQQRRPRAALL
jgi:hypothetical protein